MSTSVPRPLPLVAGALVLLLGTLAQLAPAAVSNGALLCAPASDILCLGSGRFQVEVDWIDPAGPSGRGQAGGYDADTGFFTFDDARYLELVAGVVDACAANEHFWVLATGLSDFATTLTITDLTIGTIKTYASPAGTFLNVIDTTALPCGASDPPAGSPSAAPEPGARGPAAGEPVLSLAGGRLEAQLTWEDFVGNIGDGQPVPLTSHGGAFWFFTPERLDLTIKTFDDRDINPFFQIFFGGSTNIGFTLTVTDVCTGAQQSYDHPVGMTADPVVDLTAFAALPDCLAIFSDGFESGDTTLWSATVP